MLTVPFGSPVNFMIDGHSTTNGAPIPDTAQVVVLLANGNVATVGPVVVPPGGSNQLVVPLTVVAAGVTDGHVEVTLADGTVLSSAVDTLTVTAVTATLASVSGAFVTG